MSLGKMLFSGEGRIRRRDYWIYSIGLMVVYLIIYIGVAVATGTLASMGETIESPTLKITEFALNIAFLWPSLCIQIKRWHDRDKRGAWVLINFIPIIGWIWSFIELGFLDGTPGRNTYGHSPKGLGKEKIVSAFD